MQQQIEEWGCVQRQGGGLAEEVKKLKAHVTKQEWVLVDKSPWSIKVHGSTFSQLTRERMDEMLQERLNTLDNTIE